MINPSLAAAFALVLLFTTEGVAIAQVSASEYLEQIDAAEREASEMQPKQISDEMDRLRASLTIKRKNGQSPWTLDSDLSRQTGYMKALKQQRMANDPNAAFHYAVQNIRICYGLHSVATQDVGNVVSDCWMDSMDSFKLASKVGIGTASFSVGRMYEMGWGVRPSKLAAADWYIKAVEQHNSEGAREKALTALEAALEVVPDHPEALRLKKRMLR